MLPFGPVLLKEFDDNPIVFVGEIRFDDAGVQLVEVSLSYLLARAIWELSGDQPIRYFLPGVQVEIADEFENLSILLLRPCLAGMAAAFPPFLWCLLLTFTTVLNVRL